MQKKSNMKPQSASPSREHWAKTANGNRDRETKPQASYILPKLALSAEQRKKLEKNQNLSHNILPIENDRSNDNNSSTPRRSSDDKPTDYVAEIEYGEHFISKDRLQALEAFERAAKRESVTLAQYAEAADEKNEHYTLKLIGLKNKSKTIRIRPEPDLAKEIECVSTTKVNAFILTTVKEALARDELSFTPVQLDKSEYSQEERANYAPQFPLPVFHELQRIAKAHAITPTSLVTQILAHHFDPKPDATFLPTPAVIPPSQQL